MPKLQTDDARTRIDLGQGTWLHWYEHWLSPDDADGIFTVLTQSCDWTEQAIQAGNKSVMQPRLMDWAGSIPYRYSGLTLPPKPLPPVLQTMQDKLSGMYETAFNHLVLNLYRDGRDTVGIHADDEKELGRNPLIPSLSLGATRRFVLESKRNRRRKHEVTLTHGSLLVMGGTCQHRWRHSVPREPAITEPRLNVTFRHLLGPPGTVAHGQRA